VHQQRLEILAVVGVDGDADAGVDEDLLAGHPNRVRQAAEDAPRELGGVLRVRETGMMTVNSSPPSRATSGVSASCAADLVLAVAAGGAEAERHLLEQLVARLVAEGVVDAAEVVQVDEERRHELPLRRACSRARASRSL